MMTRGLSAAERRALITTLGRTHRVRVRCTTLDLAGAALSDLTPYLLDGQVDVDSTADVTRSQTLTLSDPNRALPFDSDHPADTSLFLDCMIRSTYSVLVGDEWVSIPVFTGPVSKLDRNGDQVTVECQGKEVLAMGASWAPLTLPKGMKKTDAIRRILAERAGETSFDIPDLPARLPKPISLGRASVPWKVARSIARSMNHQLYYDGSGTCRLRTHPGTVGFTFTGRDHVTSAPQISYSGDVVNAAYVFGAIPKGSKTHVHAVAVAPRNHPLSPQRLGRNGVPRYLLRNGDTIQDDQIKTVAEAQARANQDVRDGLLQAVEVSFDSKPLPFFDPGDLCHVTTDDLSVTFRLQQFSLPLGGSDSAGMSVGYHKRTTVRPIRRRRRK